MKIISWDVGIKNLAYCILDESDNIDKPFNIYDWDIINLIEYDYKCTGYIDESNKIVPCDKTCKYTCNIDNKNYHFCNLHKNQIDKIKKNKLNEIAEISNKNCEYLIKKTNTNCGKNSKFTFNNKCYCNTHTNLLKKKINNYKLEEISYNANKFPIEKIKLNLINKLDQKLNLLDVDYCIIENQPSLKNPKMKAVADTLFNWFLIRGLIDKKNNTNIKNVIYCSPSNKLKIDEDNTVKLLSKTNNDTEKYKITKKLGIQYCQQLIKNDEIFKIKFNSFKKKDDLADAFLQGVFYLKILNKN